MKKWLFPSIFLLALAVFCWFLFPKLFKAKVAVPKESAKVEKRRYFMPIPITKFNAIQAPCLIVEIEGKPISTMLDLGFQGDIQVSSDFLQNIKEKTFLRSDTKYGGFQGKGYLRNFYKIPKIKIGKVSFSNPILEEENKDMNKDSKVVKDGSKPSSSEPGTLGWRIFGNANLLMDLGNSTIAFCDSIETIGNEGYAVEEFIKAPLLIDRGFVEFEGISGGRHMRFMLDSGCTWNVLNTPSDCPIDQLVWDPKTISESPSLQIGDKDFGRTEFHLFPIKLPIHIDAVLGMEFLSSHIVFVDFKNEQIYFAPSKKENPK